MATPNRAAVLTKAHKVLKRHYAPVKATDERNVLENLLFACLLENAPYDKAEEAYAGLMEQFFDLNEVRVTTVRELSEVMKALPNPETASANLKQMLQSVFETHYSFDLEALHKQNLGKAVQQLEKYQGVSPFVVSYTVQHGLGGHSIPVDEGSLQTLVVLGAITEAEAEKKTAPGLERAIPKTKGVEFGSLLHQLGVDYYASPFSTRVRGILLEIDPEARSRFPKRGSKKSAEEAAPEPAPKPTKKASAASAPPAKKTAKVKKKKAESKPAAEVKKGTSKKKTPAKKKTTSKRISHRKPR